MGVAMSHATWYARGLADGAGQAMGLPVQWTIAAIQREQATIEDYVAYARARAEAHLRTRKVIERRRRDARWRRELAVYRATDRLMFLGAGPVKLVRLVGTC